MTDTRLSPAKAAESCNRSDAHTNEKAGQTTDSFIGTPGVIRTHDLQYRKLALYPAELRVRIGVDNRFHKTMRGFSLVLLSLLPFSLPNG